MAGGAAALSTVGVRAGAAPRRQPANGFGLTITDQALNGRLNYFRFATSQIAWQPGVNVLLPDDYFSTNWRRYPVMYLLHGGVQDFRKFHMEDDIIGLTAGRKLIVVMPDGGPPAGTATP